MSWTFPVVQGLEHHKLRRATQKSSTRGSVSVKSRHEPVSLPEGQCASRPERVVTQPCLDCFSRPRASRSSSRGRGVGLVFLWCAPSFSLLSFPPCRFPGSCQEAGGAQQPLRPSEGLAGVFVHTSPCSGKVPPDLRGQWHQEHKAPTQVPRTFSGIPSVRTPLVRFCRCSGSLVPSICPP